MKVSHSLLLVLLLAVAHQHSTHAQFTIDPIGCTNAGASPFPIQHTSPQLRRQFFQNVVTPLCRNVQPDLVRRKGQQRCLQPGREQDG